jgi:hypothetical protein
MTTIEERAKRICTNTFCNQSHTPVCKTCAWRLNSEPAEPQCRVSEYKDVIKDIYESAICQLILQREELTQWNNPFVKDMPKGNVLVKYIAVGRPNEPYYTVGRRKPSGVWSCENELATSHPRFEIVGWRPIHE